jgi:hypothetical protein
MGGETMLRRHTIVLLTMVLCLTLGVGAAGQRNEPARGELVYSEDFSSDPGYDSVLDLYAFWDGAGGSYFALSLDVGSGLGRYMGYSPEFAVVSGDFTVSFDMVVLAQDWGCYPGVVFQNTNVSDPSQPDGYHVTFSARFSWSDYVVRKFTLQSDQGGSLETAASPNVGEWYHFEVVYHSASQTADWTIESGGVFYQVTGVSFPISAGFNRLYIGEVTQPPKYGEQSAIRVDNIAVWSGEVPVERTSWGSIKASYR